MTGFVVSVDQINSMVGMILWPLFRIAAVFSILPVLGGAEVPARIRIGLALIITMLVLPNVGSMPEVDPLSLGGMLITAQQIIIGIAIGLCILLVFNAVTLAGENIAITMGLGFAMLNDPQNGVQVPTVSKFYLIFATLLFLAFNGHYAVLELVSASFKLLPVGSELSPESIWQLLTWASVIFRGALAIALPALTAMLTVNLIMGVMTRSAPQLNLFSIGFPITMTVGFITILLTLSTVSQEFGLQLDEAFRVLKTIIS